MKFLKFKKDKMIKHKHLDKLNFKINTDDDMQRLKINNDIEVLYNDITGNVYLWNELTGDYFGIGEIRSYRKFKKFIQILKDANKN